MEFRNLTPFDALCFRALDMRDREHRVLAMKVGYRLVRARDGAWHAEVQDDDPVPLLTADRHWGEPACTAAREESDLAPFKPRCDVIVHATAHAPRGVAAPGWDVGLRVTARAAWPDTPEAPRPLHPGARLTERQQREWDEARQRAGEAAAPRVVIDKRLAVSGPSLLYLRHRREWTRTPSEPIAQLPMRWEHAFGGHGALPTDEVCFSNPRGRGWIEQRALDGIEHLLAPQIEPARTRMQQPVVVRQDAAGFDAQAMADAARGYGAEPAGFGVVGRAWAPRLALAGRYDDAWLAQRHPHLPHDFDFGYWNCAPADQQIPYLPPDARIALWNLSDPAATPDGLLTVTLPGHRALALLRLDNGALLPLPLFTDTLVIDAERLCLTLTHRLWLPADAPVRVLEARFETDPDAPLVRPQRPVEAFA